MHRIAVLQTVLSRPSVRRIFKRRIYLRRVTKNMGLYFQFVNSVSLKNVTVQDPDGAPVIIEKSNNFKEE